MQVVAVGSWGGSFARAPTQVRRVWCACTSQCPQLADGNLLCIGGPVACASLALVSRLPCLGCTASADVWPFYNLKSFRLASCRTAVNRVSLHHSEASLLAVSVNIHSKTTAGPGMHVTAASATSTTLHCICTHTEGGRRYESSTQVLRHEVSACMPRTPQSDTTHARESTRPAGMLRAGAHPSRSPVSRAGPYAWPLRARPADQKAPCKFTETATASGGRPRARANDRAFPRDCARPAAGSCPPAAYCPCTTALLARVCPGAGRRDRRDANPSCPTAPCSRSDENSTAPLRRRGPPALAEGQLRLQRILPRKPQTGCHKHQPPDNERQFLRIAS